MGRSGKSHAAGSCPPESLVGHRYSGGAFYSALPPVRATATLRARATENTLTVTLRIASGADGLFTVTGRNGVPPEDLDVGQVGPDRCALE